MCVYMCKNGGGEKEEGKNEKKRKIENENEKKEILKFLILFQFLYF